MYKLNKLYNFTAAYLNFRKLNYRYYAISHVENVVVRGLKEIEYRIRFRN